MNTGIGRAAVLAIVSALPSSALTQTGPSPWAPQPSEPLRRAVAATVRILGGQVNASGELVRQSSGSGVIITETGLILTCQHVIVGPAGLVLPEIWAGLVDPETSYLPPNKAVKLRLVKADPQLDLALLQIDVRPGQQQRFPFLPIAPRTTTGYGSQLTILGFPEAGAPTMTVTTAGVVGLDLQGGWVKVDGGVMRGASGGAAVDAKGLLVGIPARVVTDEAIPVFDPFQQVPMGSVTLGQVALLRSPEAIYRFLGQIAGAPAGPAEAHMAGVLMSGRVAEEGTGRVIPGVVVGILHPHTDNPTSGITAGELMAYARTGADGRFTASRPLPPGRYIAKFVHPSYQTFLQPFELKVSEASFEVLLKKERLP
ncbi:MAG: trypsin-like peptidase domain-containing protein [Thermoanaerobaculia bacterium]|nr:trypsin-like peptidase domain-containing protein [Thermoanaerobaculia bacterium]